MYKFLWPFNSWVRFFGKLFPYGNPLHTFSGLVMKGNPFLFSEQL